MGSVIDGLTLAARKAITKAQLAKWPKATRSEQGAILDAVPSTDAWHRRGLG